jgi:signal transduction histidine kinase
VLVNLITNALDAYEDGGIRGGLVRVGATQRGAKIELQVRDWAGGIPQDVLPHIFDELFTTKAPGRGTGLGLWIVRNLVEEGFDGKILVDSAPGRGSCFTAVVPADGGERGEGGDQLADDLPAAGAPPARSAAA